MKTWAPLCLLALALAAGLSACVTAAPQHLGAAPAHRSETPAHRSELVRVGEWRLTVHREAFTGATTCRLMRRWMEFRRQTLIIHLPTRIDSSSAVYRIDQGAAFWTRDDQMRMARKGFALDNDNLNNPSGGLVRIPAERLVGARLVFIEAVANTPRPYMFRIDGLDKALVLAGQMGCGSGGLD
jgi:hypothetical protein